MKDLEVKKRLLVAESEIYRQTLSLDIQNVRLYSLHMRRKWAGYAALKPLLLAGLPFLGALLGRKTERRRTSSALSKVIVGWKVYQKIKPLIVSILTQMALRSRKASQPAESQ